MGETYIQRSFKGPSHWNQTRGDYIPYTKPELLTASMEWEGTVYKILYGELRVSVNRNTPHNVYLYFKFEYIHDGERQKGRWYNTKFPVSALKEITNSTLTYVINDFVDHVTSETPVVCTTRITLRPNWAEWLKTIGETRPSPPFLARFEPLFEAWDEIYDACSKPLCLWSCRCRRSR